MAQPTTRDEFKAYCLRKLGAPVIKINVSDDQIDDRVDEALSYYWDFHFDGSEKQYYKYQIKQADITNRYITLPDNMIGAVRIFDISTMIGGGDMFNIRYQIALNDLYLISNMEMVPYFMARQNLAEVQQMLGSVQFIRYNRRSQRLYIDTDWTNIPVGTMLVIECYKVVDPEDFGNVWADRWLQRYATALIKQQWGDILSKFPNMVLPGNISFNGAQIYESAQEEIEKLEEEMQTTWSLPPDWTTG